MRVEPTGIVDPPPPTVASVSPTQAAAPSIPLPFELPREQTVASARIDITTGSQQTLRWREMDSNFRFLNRSGPVFETAAPSPMTGLTVSRPGTGSSNPSPSSEESANHWFLLRRKACSFAGSSEPQQKKWERRGGPRDAMRAMLG